MLEQIGTAMIGLRDNPTLIGIQTLIGGSVFVVSMLWFWVVSVVGKRE